MATSFVAQDRWGNSYEQTQQLPPKPAPHSETCPYCAQSLQHETSDSFNLLVSGLRHLGAGLFMLVRSIVRCARFLVGTVLCLIGLFGDCCRLVGRRCAHQHDRRILERLSL